MGFSGRFRPMRRCRGSVAVHLGGPPCPWVRCPWARGLAGFHLRATSTDLGPGTSRTSPALGVWELSFPFASPVVFAAASPVRLLLATSAAPLPPPRGGARCPLRRALLGLFKDRLSIGSHAGVPVRGDETALARRFAASGAGLPRRLRAARPGCRPRRLVTTSPVSSSCWLPGCCTRRRSWGSARFTLPRLSPRQRSPRRFPALRSFVPRGKLPDTLTRALRRLVTRLLLPACASPSPLPPRPSPLPAGTSRPCSSLGAVRSGARFRAPGRRCSPGLEPRRPRVAAGTRGRVRQRTFERTPSR